MSFDVLPVSACASIWVPLSAIYPYDDHFSLKTTSTMWRDGYRTVQQPLFEGFQDVMPNRYTYLYLTSALSLFEVGTESTLGVIPLGYYVSMQLSGLYITVFNNALYLRDATQHREGTFRLVFNANGSVSFLFDGKYITVAETVPYDLTVESELFDADADRQKFWYLNVQGRGYITTSFLNPNYPYGPLRIERFWSYQPSTQKVRAMGMIPDDDYTESNPYELVLQGYDLTYTVDGLRREQTWVRYFNGFDSLHSVNATEIDETNSISGVKVSRLVDYPYHSENSPPGTMYVNIANLKNGMTADCEYAVRNETP